MNGRTSNLSDILVFDRYIEKKIIYFLSHIPSRSNKDKVLDSYGRKLLNFCKCTNFIIANGRLGGDCNKGEFTYCFTQGMSTVDYLLLESS